MTGNDDSRIEAHLNRGDISPETEELSSQEQAQMGVQPGQGAKDVDGANPTDEQIDARISDIQPGAKNVDALQRKDD